MLVFEKGNPFMRAIIDSETETEFNQEISMRHFRELLSHVKAIHQLGYVHKDLRLPNFLLVENGQRAVLADLGSSAKIGVAQRYYGARETASQLILSKLAVQDEESEEPIEFYPQDDYESFFKSFLTWSDNLYPRLNALKTYFDFWKVKLSQIFDKLPTTAEEWIEAFEKRLFSRFKPLEFWEDLNWADLRCNEDELRPDTKTPNGNDKAGNDASLCNNLLSN